MINRHTGGNNKFKPLLLILLSVLTIILVAVPWNDVGSFIGLKGGIRALEDGNYNYAISNFDAALVLNPDNIEVYFYRGLANAQNGDPFQAAADYRTILKRSNDPKLRTLAEEGLRSLRDTP
jgi:tetratricopeptide (TPR) repeat protein